MPNGNDGAFNSESTRSPTGDGRSEEEVPEQTPLARKGISMLSPCLPPVILGCDTMNHRRFRPETTMTHLTQVEILNQNTRR